MVNGKKIKGLREKQGLSQVQFANICGITQAMVSKLETGQADGSIETLKAMATLFGCSMEELLKSD